ncbi:MAG: VanZ family protein [Patescibacteria group bacterium]
MLKNLLKPWLLPMLWCALIFYLSSTVPGAVSGPPWLDFLIKKSAHMFLYAVLWLLLYRALKKPFYVLLFTFFYAISDEYHQSFVPGRHPGVMDIGFDTLGGTIAMIWTEKLLPKAPKLLKKWAEILEII